ncbi:MAG: GntR family transcriptional regulator [Ruminococcaceae bacterium]|nr:GntR family transcriptional regulator [Oscillospiraceae bacterium]
MAWKFRSGLALSVQIVDRLRADILKGVYKSGDPFPTVRQLAYDAGVNPNTMQKALTLLEGEGLVITNSTNGRSVTDDEAVLDEARDKALRSFTENIVKEAKNMSLNMNELIKSIEKGWEENE